MPQRRINLLHTILLVVISVVLAGIVLYLVEDYQARQVGDRADAAEWLQQHQRDYRLKSCIDNSVKPCEIDTEAY